MGQPNRLRAVPHPDEETGRLRFVRGTAELIFGLVCLVLLVVLLFNRLFIILPMGVLMFGGLTLTADGVYSLIQSKRIVRFQ